MQAQQSLESMICDELERDPRTAHAVIDVSCVGGQVTLCGEVRSAAEKVAAEAIAKQVAGVVTVDNDVAIRAGAARK